LERGHVGAGVRRARQAIRRKCGRRLWLSHCAYIAKKPRANLFFELVMVPFYGEPLTARHAWEVATAGHLPRTFREPPRRSASDNVPF
jgi:hypothetical protein